MSLPNGLLILGDHLFLNCKTWRRRLINNGVLINPDLTLLITIVTGAYKPTYQWGGQHCIYYICWRVNTGCVADYF